MEGLRGGHRSSRRIPEGTVTPTGSCDKLPRSGLASIRRATLSLTRKRAQHLPQDGFQVIQTFPREHRAALVEKSWRFLD